MSYQIVDTSKVLAIVLAGGEGTRSEPLSRVRAKPAIPIGATHRHIDIPLSNLLHSAIAHISIAVQRRPWSLTKHIDGYAAGIAQMRGQFIRILSPPKDDPRFFESDADSLYQLRPALSDGDFSFVLIIMADQVVKVDYGQVLQALLNSDADAAFVSLAVPIDEAQGRFGVLDIDPSGLITGYEEKPNNPRGIADRPAYCHANLAMYAFRRPVFDEILERIGQRASPEESLSESIIPWLVANRRVIAYDLATNVIEGMTNEERNFFADTGSLDAWFATQMRICDRKPAFNFYSQEWPILTAPHWPMSAVKIDTAAHISEVLLGWNVILQDGVSVDHCVLSTSSLVGRESVLDHTVLLDSVRIGRGCRLERVVLDKDIVVPDGTPLSPSSPPPGTLQYRDLFQMLRAGTPAPNVPVLSDGGILFFPKGYSFPS